MANLKSIAELVYNQLFPNATDETLVDVEDFVETAKSEYAYQWWLKALNEKNQEGTFEVPSYLLTEKEFDVVDNEIDLNGVEILKGLPGEVWLQNVGGLNCDCRYVKTTINRARILCDEDSLDESDRRYYAVGKKLKFPDGTHANKLTVVYANSGEDVDGEIEVDDVIAGVIRRSLFDLYKEKAQADETNNSNPNT